MISEMENEWESKTYTVDFPDDGEKQTEFEKAANALIDFSIFKHKKLSTKIKPKHTTKTALCQLV